METLLCLLHLLLCLQEIFVPAGPLIPAAYLTTVARLLGHHGLGHIDSTNDDGAASLLCKAKLSSNSFLGLLNVVHSDLDLVTNPLLPQELSGIEHDYLA